MCNKKGVKEGYPLKIEAKTVTVRQSAFNAEFVKGIFNKVNYDTLRQAVETLKCT